MYDPDSYMSMGSSQRTVISSLLERYMKKMSWKSCERVLDVGCGTGNMTVEILLPLLPADALLCGFDISEPMVEYARTHYSHHRLNYSVQDIQGNVTEKWQNGSFDKIFSFFCLHFVTDFKQTAWNLHYLLKEDGFALLHLVTKHPLAQAVCQLAANPSWTSYLTDLETSLLKLHDMTSPIDFLCPFFVSAGFKVESSCNDFYESIFDSIDHLMSLFKSLTPFTAKVPAGKLEECNGLIKGLLLKDPSVKIDQVTGKVTVIASNAVLLLKK